MKYIKSFQEDSKKIICEKCEMGMKMTNVPMGDANQYRCPKCGDVKVIGWAPIREASNTYLTVYHGTNESFEKFDLRLSTQGIIWFASEKEVIEKGESGAQGTKFILTLKVKLNNPAGWDEYDKYSLGEIKRDGFDGVILPEKNGSFVGFVFKASQVKIIKSEKNRMRG